MTHVWALHLYSTCCYDRPVKVGSGELTRHKSTTTSRTEALLSRFFCPPEALWIQKNSLGNLDVKLYNPTFQWACFTARGYCYLTQTTIYNEFLDKNKHSKQINRKYQKIQDNLTTPVWASGNCGIDILHFRSVQILHWRCNLRGYSNVWVKWEHFIRMSGQLQLTLLWLLDSFLLC